MGGGRRRGREGSGGKEGRVRGGRLVKREREEGEEMGGVWLRVRGRGWRGVW